MAVTQARLQELLHYDPGNGVFYWKERRGSKSAGSEAGVIANDGARVIRIDKALYRAHRLAWLYEYGHWPEVIDHINGDPSDNRLVNLRNCSQAENARNVRVHRDTASGLKGAYRDKNKWTSRIFVNGKNVHLGTFPSPERAAAAYDAAARKLHGAFARTNGA